MSRVAHIIRSTPGDRRPITWCYAQLEGEWHFRDAHHAATYGGTLGVPPACPRCVHSIKAALDQAAFTGGATL